MDQIRGNNMPRSLRRASMFIIAAIGVCSATGCLAPLIATGVYLWQGGNVVPPDFDGLEGKRVVVVCRPPASHEYHHAGAARGIGARVTGILASQVPGIDVVDSKEVDNWADESDWDQFKDLGRAVEADMLVHIAIDDFNLYKGRTLYQGVAEVVISVYDMKNGGKLAWEDRMGQVLYPRHSGIPIQDKPVSRFQREFEEVVAEQVAIRFYKHDPNGDFAIDALANR